MEHWIFHSSWLGSSAFAWIVAGISALVGYIVVFGVTRFLSARFKSLAEHHDGNLGLRMSAAVLGATRGWIILFLAIAIALRPLTLPDPAPRAIGWAIAVLCGMQVAFWVSTLIVSWLQRSTPDGSMQKTNPIIYGILTWAVEMLVWVTLLLVLLGSAGVNISAFVASLGVTGLAIAMAAKNVLEDLFASISIGLDKPFTVGEFIAFGSESGTVKKVGIKSTRIDSLSGEEMAVSNSHLLQNLVHNYSRRQERRIVFGFSVPLDTPRAKVEQVTESINEIIDNQENTRRDRGFFVAIEPQGFRYEFVYYVLTPGYADYVTAQQDINLKILAQMESMKVRFAMPMQMNYEAPQPS